MDLPTPKLDVHYELDRLKTFSSSSVPDTKKDDLASLGFYYNKPDNVIKCAYCDLRILDFTKEDCFNHQCPGKLVDSDDGVHDLNCSFEESSCSDRSEESDDLVFGETDAKKYWLDDIGVQGNVAPKCPEYKKYADRLKTFGKWSSRNQKAESLCDAGFFYIGVDDRTACFHCGAGLKDWKSTDDPWIEHAHWFPNCRYVLNVKGEKFVKSAWKIKIDKSSKQEIEKATETLQSLLDVFDSKNHRKEKSNSEVVSTLAPLNSKKKMGLQDDSMICQICFEKERDVMFSPCHHIVSCSSCAVQLKKCVVCRKAIKALVKVYHS